MEAFLHVFEGQSDPLGGEEVAIEACIRTIDGVHTTISMRLDLSNPFEYAIALNSFEIATAHVIRRLLRSGDLFVDGAAHIGVFSLLASQRVGPGGQVYAFEPHPDFRLRLKDHLTMNRYNNVRVIPKGCWEKVGTFFRSTTITAAARKSFQANPTIKVGFGG